MKSTQTGLSIALLSTFIFSAASFTASGPAQACMPPPEPYDLAAGRAKIARIPMPVDTSYLSEEEKAVINKLIEAAKIMSEIYLIQVSPDNPKLRAEIAAGDSPDKAALLDMFDLYFGVWDTLDGGKPFYGWEIRSSGGGFYPQDITHVEWDNWLKAHPEDEEDFKSPYTVIVREKFELKAIPYSVYYRKWLEPAAALLTDAGHLTSNKSLRAYLFLRAYAFYTNDYFESDMAWMDLEGTPIEVVIGPYEVYTDGFKGYKAAFEAFITLKNPVESAALDRYKKYLKEMEAHLPVAEKYKNFKRGFETPIVVADQLQAGGDAVPGVQTIAFNLPNDERVREAKGAKKVLLKNVIEAKFKLILEPMAEFILEPNQLGLLDKKYMSMETLFHELAHSIGPGRITVDGRETTVNKELKELYSAIEEGKADIVGLYNILFMMEKGELPVAEKESLLATYFVGLFRSMRFGIDEAHGQGAAFQYEYLRREKAFSIDKATGLFRLNFEKLEAATTKLVHDIIVLEGNGDYEAAKAFLERYAVLDEAAKAALDSLGHIPVDIQPEYPPKV